MRYLLALLGTFGLIVLILVLLLRGGSSTPEVKPLKLADYASSDSSVQLIVDGPIVANEKHQEIKIDVDANHVVFSMYSGYEGDLIKQSSYDNNSTAYTIFLRSLQNEGFTQGNTDKDLHDERGVCPLGKRRIYSFRNGSDQLMRFWSTTCGTKTFDGNIDRIGSLFRQQIPDYNVQIANTKFDLL
jgi:hypothetical protein